jgi:hypothetical protein
MLDTRFVWSLILVPSLPLMVILFAFSKVLHSKKFEMRMLLQRGEALTKYLSAYGGTKQNATDSSAIQISPETDVENIVEQVFQLHYSLPEYVDAAAFNILVNSILMILAFSYAGIDNVVPSALMPYLRGNPYLKDVIAGGLGALIWGIYEFCNRYREGDLPPDAIFSSGARLLFASAAGAIAGELLNDRLAWVVAFGLGMLPTSAIHQFIVERTRKALNIPDISSVAADPSLAFLQGWNTDVSEKFKRAGVTSVQQLACTNQFQLFLRSNIEWRVILDLSDQALLVPYVGDAIQKLRPLGVRGAVELAEFDWSSDDESYFKGFTYYEVIVGSRPLLIVTSYQSDFLCEVSLKTPL